MISGTGENLVFILSPPRSGSTLLAAMLGSHSSVACPAEPWFLLRLAAVYALPTDLGWYDDVVAAAATRAFIDPETFRRGARELALAAYNTHLSRSGRRLFVDKTPRYYHIIAFIADTFPQAKYIWLQRNPFAIAASLKTTWGVGTDVLTGRSLTPNSFDLSLALRALAHQFEQPSPLRLEVRYETLVRSPATELQRICAFLAIPFEESMLRYAENHALLDTYRSAELGDRSLLDHPTIHSDAIDRWQHVLSADEIDDIAQCLGPALLRRLGYELPPATAPPTASAERKPSATAVLSRERSPAEPSETERDEETTAVMHALNLPYVAREQARELAQARDERDHWRTAYRDVEALLQRWPLRIAHALVRALSREGGRD